MYDYFWDMSLALELLLVYDDFWICYLKKRVKDHFLPCIELNRFLVSHFIFIKSGCHAHVYYSCAFKNYYSHNLIRKFNHWNSLEK